MAGETKWTPGPWMVAGEDLPKCIVTAARPDENLLVWNETDGVVEAPTAADARLIAAAPDLYAALRSCASILAGDTMSKQTLVDALIAAGAALAKARGES